MRRHSAIFVKKSILSLLLSAAMAISPCMTAQAGEPEIPFGENIADYDPETDGYYGLLPTRYEVPGTMLTDEVKEKETEKIYLPVLVMDEVVMVSADALAEISGLQVTEEGSKVKLNVFQRNLYLTEGKQQAMYTLGEVQNSGGRFGRLAFLLSHEPFKHGGELWLPLTDIAVYLGLNPHLDKENFFVIYQPAEDGMDALARLAGSYNGWLYYYADGQLGRANASSATATYMDGLLKFDKTSWKMLAKELALTDLWGKKLFGWDSSEDDWKQAMATELTDVLIRTGADEAAKQMQQSNANYSAALSLATDWGYAGTQKGLGAALTAAFKYGGVEEGDKALRRSLAYKCALLENADNAKFVEGLSNKVGTGLTLVSTVIGMAGAAAAFDTRDQTAVESWDNFIAAAENMNLDSVCRDAMEKRMSDYRDGSALQAMGQYLRDNWFSTAADLLSISNPLLVAYQLGSALIPQLSEGLDRAKNFQISLVAIPLEYDARDALAGFFNRSNAATVTKTELRDAFRLSYFYLKSCYTAASLGASALGESIGGQDYLLEQMALMTSCCDDDDTLPDNLITRAGYLKGGGFNQAVLPLVYPLYEEVSGGVVDHSKNDEPVEDAECSIRTVFQGQEQKPGTFAGTPGGSYDVMIPLWQPQGILPYTDSPEMEIFLSFTSPTVAGRDTVEPDFVPGGSTEAEKAYLGTFDWYVYIRDELLPLYGYADMNDMSRDVSSGNSMDSYGWNRRTGILGADVADITGDDNEDMILYRLAPQAGNNPDYVRREVLATLYTETDGKVTEHETLSVGSADGISFDLDELGLMEVQGQTCLWHNTVGSAYFADGAGQDTEFIGWDGSAFRRLWWVGKSDGGSSEIAYSFRTYSDAENYTQEVLFGDEGYMYTHPGAVTAGAKNYAEAIIMGYQRLGLPDPGVATDPNAHFSAYPGRWEDGAFPSCWDSEVLAESVLVKTSGGGSYRLRSIVDHVEDRTGLREKIEALN